MYFELSLYFHLFLFDTRLPGLSFVKVQSKKTYRICGCFGSCGLKWVDLFPQSFIFPSALDRLHCHLQRANDGCYLDEREDPTAIVESARENKSWWKDNINSFHTESVIEIFLFCIWMLGLKPLLNVNILWTNWRIYFFDPSPLLFIWCCMFLDAIKGSLFLDNSKCGELCGRISAVFIVYKRWLKLRLLSTTVSDHMIWEINNYKWIKSLLLQM